MKHLGERKVKGSEPSQDLVRRIPQYSSGARRTVQGVRAFSYVHMELVASRLSEDIVATHGPARIRGAEDNPFHHRSTPDETKTGVSDS